jgi:DNA-binding beta-propeller fold protein YncE
MSARISTIAAALAFASMAATAADKTPHYKFVKEIPIPGDTGWDYLSVDPEARRLYVTHGTHIVVLDLDSDTIVGDIGDTPGVHGFAVAHDLGRGFSSNGAESKVSVVDLKTLATTTKLDSQPGPDAIVYEPTHHEVYAFNGHAQSFTVFSATSNTVVESVKLPGKPEFPTVDAAGGKIFVNIEDQNEVAVIDTATHKVTNLWPIAPGESASGMAIDVKHHRLFVGCENHLMLMMDNLTGKVVGSVPIGTGVDANAFDEKLQLAFSSNGEGTVTIAREASPDQLQVVQTLQTQPSARTLALDPETHRIYLAAATWQTPPPGATPTGHRHAMVPGTFKILVYEPLRMRP